MTKELVQCYICGRQVDAYKSFNIHYDFPPSPPASVGRRRVRWVCPQCLPEMAMSKRLNVEIVDMASGELIRSDADEWITPIGMDTLPRNEMHTHKEGN